MIDILNFLYRHTLALPGLAALSIGLASSLVMWLRAIIPGVYPTRARFWNTVSYIAFGLGWVLWLSSVSQALLLTSVILMLSSGVHLIARIARSNAKENQQLVQFS